MELNLNKNVFLQQLPMYFAVISSVLIFCLLTFFAVALCGGEDDEKNTKKSMKKSARTKKAKSGKEKSKSSDILRSAKSVDSTIKSAQSGKSPESPHSSDTKGSNLIFFLNFCIASNNHL